MDFTKYICLVSVPTVAANLFVGSLDTTIMLLLLYLCSKSFPLSHFCPYLYQTMTTFGNSFTGKLSQNVPVKELESRSVFRKDMDSDKVEIKSVCCFFYCQDARTNLEQATKTRVGAEPKLVVQVSDACVECVFICGDGLTICQMSNLTDAVLALIALYFTINLEYPKEYSQLLGLIQLMCMGLEFPPSLRSTAFTCLKESL